MLVSLRAGVHYHLEASLLGMLANLFEHLAVERLEVQMSDGHSLAVPWQIQKHILIAEALSVLVLNERIAVSVELDLAREDKVHGVTVITSPVEHVSLVESNVDETLKQLPHELVVLHRLQEVDPIDHLAVRDQEDLVTQARRQRLDQLLVLVLCDERHDIGLNILLDLLGGVEGDLGLSSELREALDAILDRLLDLAAAG